MTGADWIWALAASARAPGRSLYLLGSEPGVAREAADAPAALVPAARGRRAPTTATSSVGSPHDERVIEDINAAPARHRARGHGHAQAGAVGGPLRRRARRRRGVDGRRAVRLRLRPHAPRAPHWLADNGLEWIFRLGIEPRRMWRRYLLGNPVFLSRVIGQARERRALRA